MNDVSNLIEHVALLVTAITGFVVVLRRTKRNGHRIDELERRMNGGTDGPDG